MCRGSWYRRRVLLGAGRLAERLECRRRDRQTRRGC